MTTKLNLYWRWLRIKRVKVRRLGLPIFSRMSEYAAGDNFPVLARICNEKYTLEEL